MLKNSPTKCATKVADPGFLIYFKENIRRIEIERKLTAEVTTNPNTIFLEIK